MFGTSSNIVALYLKEQIKLRIRPCIHRSFDDQEGINPELSRMYTSLTTTAHIKQLEAYLFIIVAKSERTSDSLASGTFLVQSASTYSIIGDTNCFPMCGWSSALSKKVSISLRVSLLTDLYSKALQYIVIPVCQIAGIKSLVYLTHTTKQTLKVLQKMSWTHMGPHQ